MLSSFATRAGLAGLLLIFGMSNRSFAWMITLGQSASDSVQIMHLTGANSAFWEIQLGGGNNQPPQNTFVTGTASATVGVNTFSGFYRLSTATNAQLQMSFTSTISGTDRYDFRPGFNLLAFVFSPNSNFSNPYLTAPITNVYATQQVPIQSQNPPILLIGTLGTPTGGSLLSSFGSGDSQLSLNVGGNQRLKDLTPGNSFSGMRLENGTLQSVSPVPAPPTLLLAGIGSLGLVVVRRFRR